MYNLKLFIIRLAMNSCLGKWRAELDDAEFYIDNSAKFFRHISRANKYADRYLKLAKKREEIIEETKLEAWLND